MSSVLESKVPLELRFNTTLLTAAFFMLILVIMFSPHLFGSNLFFGIQLVLSIPLIATSSLVRVKIISEQESSVLYSFGHLVFVLGYATLINSLGLLLSMTALPFIGTLFLLANICMALIYSLMLIIEGKEAFVKRAVKDLLFCSLIIFLGILPIYYHFLI